ncbi:transglutaminase family protein [Paracoccus sp. (in: a-proteobacteria)]|uniref:transglutaminase family protein n=1 Tax=Paracoccus sp. TaxID=267 RepID=UPI003A883B37
MTTASLYDIGLRIGYDYDHPAAANRTILRMLPLTRPGQQLITGLVGADPAPDFRRDGVDFFGNPMAEMAFDRPLGHIEFRFHGRVRVEASEAGLDLSQGLAELAAEITACRSIRPDSPHHFLGSSPRVRLDREFSDFAAEVLAGPPASARESAMTICNALHDEFDFDPSATDVTTSPLEAFRNRRGVCQDISHAAIAVLRAAGIPAGYVSGFIRTSPPPGQPRLEGADAMHAWVRVWCGSETGWIEIDPTNAMLAGSDHIAAAIGRDYSDIAPVKGAMRSVGRHRTYQRVDVVPVG